MIAAPFTTYPLNDDELADELRRIDATEPPIELQGPVTVTVGIRLDPLTGKHHPAVLVRCEGNDDLHVLALPDTGP